MDLPLRAMMNSRITKMARKKMMMLH